MNELPKDVEILLTSSDNKYYKTDERRIGFQAGAKWVRSIAEQQINDLKDERDGLRLALENSNKSLNKQIKELTLANDKLVESNVALIKQALK